MVRYIPNELGILMYCGKKETYIVEICTKRQLYYVILYNYTFDFKIQIMR